MCMLIIVKGSLDFNPIYVELISKHLAPKQENAGNAVFWWKVLFHL